MKTLNLNKFSLLIGISALYASAAFATAPVLITGSVTFTNYVQLSSKTEGQLIFVRYSEDAKFAGDISGTGQLIGKYVQFPDGSNVFNEIITVKKGTILGKRGTFQEHDNGAVNTQGAYLIRGIIPNGTYGLKDINSVLQFQGSVITGAATYQGFVSSDQ